MNDLFIRDYERFTPHKYKYFPCMIRCFRNHELGLLFWFRQYQIGGKVLKTLVMPILRRYRRKYGIELPYNQCVRNCNGGRGIRLIHPWCITVNADTILCENVTLYKGCTIGEIKQGTKAGVPTIGKNVTLYANSTVCGNVRIGDNSEIAAGTFVNFDVPPNSIVIGNPGIIHAKK